jgi:catechol 2,3-dioxygenase-like lactoylglutathione lyase family enzyme
MKLNHINLAVANVEETASFFEKFFQFRRLETKGGVLIVLSDEAGFILILSHFDASENPQYPRDFHIGFIRDTRQQVNEVFESLKSAGIEANPPRHAHGGWGFYIHAPGGILVEVTSYAQ